MSPETTQKPDEVTATTVAPAVTQSEEEKQQPAAVVATPPVTNPSPPAPSVIDNQNNSPLPSALQPTDTAFNSLQAEKDIWRTIWHAIYGVNLALAALFLVFMALSLLNAGGSEFSAGAIGTPFWILPLLIMADLLFVAVYYVLKRPKMADVTRQGIWLGASFAAALLAAIAYVVAQTVV